ncbi:MAG: GtrA family protein [Sphaerochaetaceae bacterium]
MSTVNQLTPRQNILQALKFTLFSASAGLIEVVSFTLFFELFHWPNRFSYFTALVLSVLYNFTVNRSFTFQSAANVPKAMALVAAYYAVFTPLSTWWVDPLVQLGINAYVVLLGTMLINFVSEFLFYRFVVYRTSINTNRRGIAEQQRYEKQKDR